MENTNTSYIIAIDIAKDSLRVQTRDRTFDLTNDKRGFTILAKHAAKHDHVLVVFEATGGYERPLADYFHARNIALARINPRQLRAFARSQGMKAKTDPIDTIMIYRFASQRNLRPTPAPSPEQRALADLLDRRHQLTSTLASEKNRTQKYNGPSRPIAASLRRQVTSLTKEIARLEDAIRTLIEQSANLKMAVKIMSSVKGVGEVTAWSIIAYLTEIDQLNRNQLSALVGVAPFNDDSGSSSGRRYIQGGRAKVRNALYMAAHVAARWNPVIKVYVEGLLARGKPYKCAIVAAMRKLIIHIQSLLKKHQISFA